MSTPPDLSVVLVTHNGTDLALATLRSARESCGAARVEWLVVDSGSGDGAPEAIALEFPDVRVLCRSNIGFAASNNVALPLAQGRYVLLLNPDVEVLSGTLGGLVSAMDARPDVGAASVIQRGDDGRLLDSIRRFPSPSRQLGEALSVGRIRPLRRLQEPETRPHRYERECSVDWLVGAFLVVRARAIEDVGPLDERFFLYSEETDWCYRLRRAGWDIRHLPVMEVLHHCGGYGRAELAAQLSYSKLLFARKHFGRPRRLALRGALILRHALRVVSYLVRAANRPPPHTSLHSERLALAVGLGLYRPPLGRDRDLSGGGAQPLVDGRGRREPGERMVGHGTRADSRP